MARNLEFVMDVSLRPYNVRDFEFARQLYFETMRWAIERVFGWDQNRQEASFAGWFSPGEVSIITADGLDVGWIQRRNEHQTIFLGSIYVVPAMQRRGIGTRVIKALIDSAREQSKVLTLGVMKINPALGLYKRLGFQITHDDEYKFYMTAGPKAK